jgi:hypothetical protein
VLDFTEKKIDYIFLEKIKIKRPKLKHEKKKIEGLKKTNCVSTSMPAR